MRIRLASKTTNRPSKAINSTFAVIHTMKPRLCADKLETGDRTGAPDGPGIVSRATGEAETGATVAGPVALPIARTCRYSHQANSKVRPRLSPSCRETRPLQAQLEGDP